MWNIQFEAIIPRLLEDWRKWREELKAERLVAEARAELASNKIQPPENERSRKRGRGVSRYIAPVIFFSLLAIVLLIWATRTAAMR